MRLAQMVAMSALAALSMPTMIIGASPAFAIDIPIGSGTSNLNRNSQIDLQILESRERRLDFQNQQQEFRAEDRRLNQAGQVRLDIPRMQGSCTVQLRGNRFLRACR